MLTKEQYNYFNQFRQVLELFYNTGQYVGGCDALFDYKESQGLTGGYKIDRNCSGCKAAALIESYNAIKNYESNMQSM